MNMPITTPPRASSRIRELDAARLFCSAARRYGGRAAVRAGAVERSYAELLDRSGRLAAGLVALGLRPGDRVALLLPNGIRFIEAWWAAVRAGGVALPINPRASAAEVRVLLDDAEPRFVVADGAHPALAELPAGVASMGTADQDALIAAHAALPDDPGFDLDAPCAMYYTAGSTGRPKGVVRSHLSVAWGLAMLARRLVPDDVLLARAPMAHTGGSLTGPFSVLIAGGLLVIPERTDVAGVVNAAAQHRVTHLYVHPTIFAKGLLAHLERETVDLAALKRLQWTAGPLPESVRSALMKRFPHLPIEVTFGMTEASNIATYDTPARNAGVAKAAHCVGYPLPGAETRIADASGRPLPAGAEGEVQIRTPTAFSGYWRAPELTAAATTPDGWLRTGDIGMLDADGALYLCGRQREIIKSGGMTVHPAEVEQALAQHPRVADAVVFGLAHAEWDEAVTAVVAPVAGTPPPDAAELLAHCRALLAGYKCPKQIHLVAELPRNASGKVDKRAAAAALIAETRTPLEERAS
jgi:acyl-CoA synthetase (AMP-forming)/AMP-acid ligase II